MDIPTTNNVEVSDIISNKNESVPVMKNTTDDEEDKTSPGARYLTNSSPINVPNDRTVLKDERREAIDRLDTLNLSNISRLGQQILHTYTLHKKDRKPTNHYTGS